MNWRTQTGDELLGANAPGSDEDVGQPDVVTSPVRGKLVKDAPLDRLVWFKSGGAADYLFEPADLDDLTRFLSGLDEGTPVMALGLGSNLIIRDGGVPGVVVRLGKPFASVEVRRDNIIECGGGAPGILVASTARDAGIAGLEFLRGIPGTVGGFVRMNGGAYGREVADILIDCDVVMPGGECVNIPAQDLGYSYRHSKLPDGAIVVAARFQGDPGDPVAIGKEMDRIAAEREASQPLRSKTGGSTFKNPDPAAAGGRKAWQLVDEAGCRGLKMGGAQVSEKHANFLINTGDATSSDIEGLGEEIRRRVSEKTGVALEWEIQRVGRP
ncbi:UDP-N-acetylmuramate dehydrogenase [Alteraurantiacibacter aestuarii]|uniref:UDP-N-acetylenolpyruvoylglucosamine reductase n=1 Tax=Alteraurantiacibacter aestuarii TaxID=650004 RepID=A0A844ZPJ5_9SPHN|nr:UDP-N-acetylmuramate dehydrogenase [Alteraurantiacibacter aestuarii]MXO88960.1 UDP-N-acetylmuramate dehydrogenase [Alteraurantiacibacter aestuarii]